jgi:hypothetical protein
MRSSNSTAQQGFVLINAFGFANLPGRDAGGLCCSSSPELTHYLPDVFLALCGVNGT